MIEYSLETLNACDFAPFGTIIEHGFDTPTGRDFQIVVSAHSTGWTIGILELAQNIAPYLERHLYSQESHEPLSGTSIIIVATPEAPENFRMFLLDKPVCLKEGIWHQVMAISEKAVIKVVENLDVSSKNSETREFPGNIKLKIAFD